MTDTMEALVATQCALEATAFEACKAEAKVDMVQAEVAELVLDRMV